MYDDRQFPCEKNGTRSQQRPTSVHKLRPGDIDVIGAIGDSLTAGFGTKALNILQLLNEDRGHSFSIGSKKKSFSFFNTKKYIFISNLNTGGYGTWRDTLTLPNILKEFNPKLIGYSLRTSLSIERASQFNVAEGGAVSDEMFYMSKILIKRIRNDPRVNFKEDWKVLFRFTYLCFTFFSEFLNNIFYFVYIFFLNKNNISCYIIYFILCSI